jgi:predicted dehydrogenase
MTRTIRWGIIGVGNVTEVKSGPGFQKVNNSELVAVMRRDGALAKDYAERHGVPRWYDDAQTLIDDPGVDAVYIATPPHVHKEYTLKVAQAGKPVYVEKPMALNYDECREMVEVCKAADVPLFVAFYRRALPRFLKVKQLVNSGAIGEVRLVMMTIYENRQRFDPDNLPWRVLPEVAGGGFAVDLGTHMVDLMDYILGPMNQVSGFASNQGSPYPAEDIVTASYTFESGAHGTAVWCFTAYDKLDRTEIVGTKGKISFAAFADAPVVLETADGVEQFDIPHPPHVQQPLIQSIVDELNGVGTCPSTGESAARSAWVMDRMLGG